MTTEGLGGTVSGLFGARQPERGSIAPQSSESVVLSTLAGGIAGRFDGFLSEQHSAEVATTSYPVEDGETRIDHAVRLPLKLTLEGWTSTWRPIGAGSSADERPADAWQYILDLMDRREAITVTTALATYENMLVTKASAPADRSTGGSLRFTLELEEILRGELRDTSVPSATTGPAADRIESADLGNVVTEFVSDDETAYLRSEMEYLGLQGEDEGDRFSVIQRVTPMERIPVDPQAPNQSLKISLGGRKYQLKLAWLPLPKTWRLSVNGSGGEMILAGRQIVPSNRIVRSPHFPGDLVAVGSTVAGPFDRNAWQTHDLIYLTPESVDEVDWLL